MGAHAPGALKDTEARRLARFVTLADAAAMTAEARDELLKRVLDSIGVAIAALDGQPIGHVRAHVADFGGTPHCTLIGGGKTAPDRAAFYNGALVRYLDFMDAISPKARPVIRATIWARCSPRPNTPISLARNSFPPSRSPIRCNTAKRRRAGPRQGLRPYGSGRLCGCCRRLAGARPRREQTANAIAISGTCNNALRVTRTGALSHWKGLAYPNTAFVGTHAAFLAYRGITGPEEVFEGNKGFKDAIAGPFEIDWSKEDLEIVRKSILKKYNAEIHSQSSIEGALELQARHGFKAKRSRRSRSTFSTSPLISSAAARKATRRSSGTKEEADHSLPYMVGVALIDGNVLPAQYAPTASREMTFRICCSASSCGRTRNSPIPRTKSAHHKVR